jgi:RNA polymerase sigma factor (TIGR02999 family)
MCDDTTRLLDKARRGDQAAIESLLPRVYDELKAIATAKMRAEPADHTLQPTALVNEAFLRLVDQQRTDWQGSTHFCAVAASMMRRILVDHARRKAAGKRGAKARHVVLDEAFAPTRGGNPVDIVALDDLLQQLTQLNSRHARVVELRCFGGLGVKETAHALGVSPATVKNDWRVARAWLMRQLSENNAADAV